LLIQYPRLVIAGISGDSGKTLVSCGLLAFYRKKGLSVAAFKKGPDYIDASWLTYASGNPCRNLDTYIMNESLIKDSFRKNAYNRDLSIIEGNRGLFDGFDAIGTHSTAELAKILKAPVILVLNVTKMTRTAAAIVLGCKLFDKNVKIAGVILNQVSGERQLKIIRENIEFIAVVPVLGAIPRQKNQSLLPSRHLGLITPGEFEKIGQSIETASDLIEEFTDANILLDIAQSVDKYRIKDDIFSSESPDNNEKKVKIGYFYDKAFSFYYPENLESLEKSGAEVVKISSIEDKNLPDIDGLYIGGGFPEEYPEELANNSDFIYSLKEKCRNGLPVYAECGGMIYLAESIDKDERTFDLTGILPVKMKLEKMPQGHGYYEIKINRENPFFEMNKVLRGHEFHYSKIIAYKPEIETCMQVLRGKGAFNESDGLIMGNIFGTFFHVHAAANPEWAEAFVDAAWKFKIKYNN
jgi:cobyrinic acid a,c-diamide synthase